MEKRITSLVFRRLTYADFRHINKVGGEEQGGGGQSYIDFPTGDISLQTWFLFLGQNTSVGAQDRPIWEFTINSIGLKNSQKLKIYQRRNSSISVASQKIHSKESNRIAAWHPKHSFPIDFDPDVDNLIIYIAKTDDNEFWAGWFLKNEPPKNWDLGLELEPLFKAECAYIEFSTKTFIDTENKDWPFYFRGQILQNQLKKQADKEEDLINEDTSPRLLTLLNAPTSTVVKEKVLKIRQRNGSIVKNLKEFYQGKCQISGESLTFKKKNGEWYCEVHHLIPLGENGSDDYSNVIVVSPLIHRMLHYAEVSPIDLSKIQDNKLAITINNKPHEITWHPEHLKIVEISLAD
jgi:5-methylcytosine-specific restriction enzyme A